MLVNLLIELINFELYNKSIILDIIAYWDLNNYYWLKSVSIGTDVFVF